jgi:hypothetical protein
MPQRFLRVSKEQAKKLFRQQIEEGRRLENQPVTSFEELQHYKRERFKYTNYNIEMLSSVFGTDMDAFWTYSISTPRSGLDLDEELAFYKDLDKRQLDELISLQKSLDIIPVKVESNQVKAEVDLPEKVSLAWLYRHVPFTFWLMLGGALLAALTFGVTMGQTTFIRQLFEKELTKPNQPQITNSTGAHIEGVIKESGGFSTIAEVEVTVSTEKKQVVYSTFTDSQGKYATPTLQPGIYSLTFKDRYYETSTMDSILLSKDETVYLNVGLVPLEKYSN